MSQSNPQPKRSDARTTDTERPLHFDLDFVRWPLGSVLVSLGTTRVLCCVNVDNALPSWMQRRGEGWLTAEYALLPGSTHTRSKRERSNVGGRTQEIQRLLGRALRLAVDRKAIGERTILIDADVLQADGGTRTAAITGSFVALALALWRLHAKGELQTLPLLRPVAAISCGVVAGHHMLDLDYGEDSRADVDMNIVASCNDALVEVQGTAEGALLPRTELDTLVDLALGGCRRFMAAQRSALEGAGVALPASFWGLDA